MNANFLLRVVALSVYLSSSIRAADLQETIKLFRRGEYEKCCAIARAEVDRSVWNEGWPTLVVESLLTLGEYEEAVAAYEKSIERFSTSLRLRMLGAEAYRLTNNAKQARATIQVVPELIQRVPWRFTAKSELVALGEYYLLEGEDPRQVLELCFDKVVKSDPNFVEAHVASARLAVAKNDDQTALTSLKKAVELDDEDPEIFYLLARAWSGSDSEKASSYIKEALSINPRHPPSLLWLASLRMDAEAYDDAERILQDVEVVNAKHPVMWALRAAAAHLQGKYEREGEARRTALVPWPLNPEVDYLIGKTLADHYRFAESVEYQRRSLVMQSDYLPAKVQLALDLLRQGKLDEGWQLVDEARKADPYDVPIFNLTKLRSRLEKFATLEGPGFILRMDATEAKIYGEEVLKLLGEARDVLAKKYETKLDEPVSVEIFPKQGDFAIRTFGLPGGAGFLGVCFGKLITANSPAALDVDSNWKSVLWHEYCHVVTLQKTKNRMPRWLSEGISVYEERLRDRRWGETMTPDYRRMLLGDELVPVSRLSGAFLRPPSPLHLQFAYYESSLVVEYWIEKYGLHAMLQLLNDLSVGMAIDEALGRQAGGIAVLDAEFEAFARTRAEAYGPTLDFEAPDDPPLESLEDWQAWLVDHPNSIFGMQSAARLLILEKRWSEALDYAEKLDVAIPDDPSINGGTALLATIYRGLDRKDDERIALVKLASVSSDNLEALQRLIEIDLQADDKRPVLEWCERACEINPLLASVQMHRAEAAEAANEPQTAVAAWRAVSELEPVDPATVYYRLSKNLFDLGRIKEAEDSVLAALEESPRYREALNLLLRIDVESNSPEKPESRN
jgi:tetratricopeptide (TPR) repeat protein